MSAFLNAETATRQIGIRQRSLRKHCRLGRATELVFLLATGVMLTLGAEVRAQTWDGETDTDWSVGTNWSADAVPIAGGTVIIDGTGATEPTLDVASANLLSTTISAGTLTVAETLNSATVILSGSGNLTINSGRTVQGSDTPTATAVTMDSTGTLTNDGTIDGSLGVSDGTVNNGGTVTGALTVSGGVVNVTGAGLLTGASVGVSGGTLNVDAGGLAASAVITISNTGTLDVSGANTVTSLTQLGGTIQGSGPLATGTFSQSGGDLAGLVNATTTKTLTGGTISGTLGGAGTTTVQTGTTTVTGTIDGNVTVGSGGTLRLDSATAVSGTITTTGSVVSYADGMNEGSELIVSSATTQLEVLTGEAGEQSGVISATGTFGIEKIGEGALTLSAVNTYTGTTRVTEGTLTVSGSIVSPTVTVASGATLGVTGTGSATGLVTNNGGTVTNSGTVGSVDNNSGDFDNSGIITTTVRVDGGTFDNLSGGDVGGQLTAFAGAANNQSGAEVESILVSGGDVDNAGDVVTTVSVTAGTFDNILGGDVGGRLTASGGTANNHSGAEVESILVSGGNVDNAGNVVTTVSVTSGTFDNQTGGTVDGNVTVSGGTSTNAGTLGDATSDSVTVSGGTFTNQSGGIVTGRLTASGGTATNDQGGTANAATVTSGTLTNSGDITTTVSVTGGTFGNTSTGTVDGSVTVSAGTVNNAGALGDAATDRVTVSGTGIFNNNSGGDVAGLLVSNGGTSNNNAGAEVESVSVTAGDVNNAGTVNTTVSVTGGTFDNLATGDVNGRVTVNGGTLTNAADGELEQLVHTSGSSTNSGNIVTTVSVAAGTFTNESTGTVGGNVTQTGGTINNTGDLGDAATDTVSVSVGTFNNNSGGDVAGLLWVRGGTANNNTGAEAERAIVESGDLDNGGDINTTVVVTTGTFDNLATGTVGGNVTLNGGITTNAGDLGDATTDRVLVNAGATFTNLSGGDVAGQLLNAGGTSTNEAGAEVETLINTSGGSVNEGSVVGFARLDTGTLDNALGASIGTTLTVNGGDATNAGSVGGITTVNGGTLTLNAGSDLSDTSRLTVTGGAVDIDTDETVGALSGSGGGVNFAGQTLTVGSAGGNPTSTYSGNVTGDTLVKEGTGTQTLNGAVSVTTANVNGGTLRLDNGGISVGTVNVAGGTLSFNAAAAAGIGAINTTGSVIDYANGSDLGAAINVNSNDTQLQVLAGAATQSGNITETAGPRSIEKIGAGTLTLSGTNAFTGDATITGGTLRVTGGAALDNAVDVIVGAGGTFDVAATEEIGSLATTPVGPTPIPTASVSIASGRSLLIVGSADTTFAGNLSGGGTLFNNGGGTLTLTGANSSYTGTLLAGNAGSEIALTENGATASAFVGAIGGGLITTDGGALLSTANLSVEGGTLTLTGSETVSRLRGNAAFDFTGTVNVDGVGTVLTLNGSTGASGIAGAVTGTGALSVTGGTTTVTGTGNVQVLTTIGAGATGGTVVNDGTMADVENDGTFTNNGTAGDLTNLGDGAGSSSGSLTSLTHDSTGTFTNTGTISGDTAVSAGIVNLNAGSDLSDTGTLAVTGGAVNVNTAETVGVLDADGGTVTTTATLTADELTGDATGSIVTTGTGDLIAGGANTDSQFDGVISGTGSFEKEGTGTLTLTNDQTYAGTTTVSGGTLELLAGATIAGTSVVIDPLATLTTEGGAFNTGTTITNDGTFSISGDESIASLSNTGAANPGETELDGGDLTLNSGTSDISGEISGSGSLVVTGTSTTTLSGANTYEGTTTINSATAQLNLNGGAAIADAGVVIVDAGRVEVNANEVIGSLEGAGGTVDLNANTLTTGGNNGSTEYAGSITGTGGLTKTGTGTMTLTGTNDYSGDTAINGGTLTVENGSALSDTGNVIVGNGGTFTVTDQETIGNLSSADTAASTAVVNNNGGLVIAGSADTTFDGNIMGTAALTYQGTGSLTLTAANDMTGTLFVQNAAGEVILSGDGAIASSRLVIQSGAVTTDGGALETDIEVLMDAGTLTLEGSEEIGALGGDAQVEQLGTVTLTGAGTTLTINGSAGNSDIGGTITGTGELVVSGGTTTVASSGDVQTDTSVLAGGVVVNNGSMAAVDNAGAFTANDGSDTGALTNTGTADINATTAVTDVASITNNAGGTVTIDGGAAAGQAVVVAGAIDVNAGSVTTTGHVIAASVANDATVNAEGTLDADVTNAATGTFNVTGDLLGGGEDFINDGDLNVTAGNYTGLSVLTNNATGMITIGDGFELGTATGTNAGTITIGAGSTLSANAAVGSFVNNNLITLADGSQVDGGLTNSATGSLVITGDAGITGAFSNLGTVDMTTDTTVGQTLTVGSVAGASAGTYLLDLNLSTGATDRIVATGGGATGGVLDFSITGTGFVGAPITVFTGAADGAAFTSPDLPRNGAIIYSLQQNGANIDVISLVNPAVSGVVSSAAMTQSLIGTVVNRPTSPFVSGLAAEEGCSSGGYGRVSAGQATVTGTAVSNDVGVSNDIRATYYGVQGGYDVGCFDGRFFNGWDGAIGVMAGYNSGSTRQTVFADPIAQTDPTSTTGSDFSQTYVGMYIAGARDKISGDVQLRYDNTKFTLTEDFLAGIVPEDVRIGLDGQEYGTRSTTLGARLNYRFDLNEEKGISLVPTAGFNYTSVTGDVVDVLGADGIVSADDGTLTLDPFNQFVGFVGGTLTKTKINEAGDAATTFFASGNYYHDFAGSRTATYDSVATPNQPITVDGLGGFAEASLGLNYVKVLENGPGGAKQLNANIRADARFGSNVSNAYSLTAQVRLSF